MANSETETHAQSPSSKNHGVKVNESNSHSRSPSGKNHGVKNHGLFAHESNSHNQSPSGMNNGVTANEFNEPIDISPVLGAVDNDTLVVDPGDVASLEKLLKKLKNGSNSHSQSPSGKNHGAIANGSNSHSRSPSVKDNGVIANEFNKPMDTNSVPPAIDNDKLVADSGETPVLEKILNELKEVKLAAKKLKNTEDVFTPLRIAVTRKDSDGTFHGGAHEIISVDTTLNTRRDLAIFLKDKFRDIERSNSTCRRNIPDRSAWGKDYELESAKAIWDTGSDGWNINKHLLTETYIHDLNCKDVLGMMKVRNSKGFLHVIITHVEPLKEGEMDAEGSGEHVVSDA